MTHELKVLSEYYWKIPCEKKTFELRKDDRDYKVGDILDLKEWDGEKFTGHHVRREITYILRNCKQYGLEDGYCIIGMQPRTPRNRLLIAQRTLRKTIVLAVGQKCRR